MRVLMIGRAYPEEQTGMMGIFEYEQARALGKDGDDAVYAFCDTRSVKRLRKYGSFQKKAENVSTYGYHLPIGGLPQKLFAKVKLQYFKRIMNAIQKNDGLPDIIHIHFPLLTMTMETWEMLKGLNRPIVVTEHWSKVQTKKIEPFRRNLLQKIVLEADTFICVGEPLKRSVIALTNTKREIKVLPNMVSPLFHYKAPEKKANIYEFLAVGRLVESKGFEHLISSFGQAFRKNKDVKLTIVGGGPQYSVLQNQIKNLELENQVTLTGYLSRGETAKYMRLADAYVSASVLETFGVPFIEALVSGKPVLGIEGNPIASYIHSTNGLLVPPGNMKEMIKALEMLYVNRNRFHGEKIAEEANQHFSEQAVVSKLKAIYSSAISERSC